MKIFIKKEKDMKKILIAIAISTVVTVANADYLNWTVGSTFEGLSSGSDYNAAKIFWTTTDSNSTGTYLGLIDPTPGVGSVNISSIQGYDNLGFYIEVYNYDAAKNEYNSVSNGKSQYYAYSELSGTGAITTSFVNAAAIAYAFNGSGVQATPEPTSGLLMLMGFAMLGLKRKKEV